MAQQLADHHQRNAVADRYRGEAMARVMQAHIWQGRAVADFRPMDAERDRLIGIAERGKQQPGRFPIW